MLVQRDRKIRIGDTGALHTPEEHRANAAQEREASWKTCFPRASGNTVTQKTSPPALAYTASRSRRSLQLKDEAPQQQTQDFHSHPYLTKPAGGPSLEQPPQSPAALGNTRASAHHPCTLLTSTQPASGRALGTSAFREGSITPASPHPTQKAHTSRGAHRPSFLPLQGNTCPHGQTITFACRGRR